MKYFLDTEFIERGRQHPIELISIGIACEDGREFYAISREFKSIHASKWVQDNVLKPLTLDTATPRESISVIASAIQGFVGDEHPEFWGYYCLAPETRVLTADLRWIALGDITVGTPLMGFEEESNRPGEGRSACWRRWQSSLVTHTQTIQRPCYDLAFDDGTRVRASADHRWLTANQKAASWMTTESLFCNADRGSNIVKPVDLWSPVNTRSAGYLAAAFDGEGHLSQRSLDYRDRGVYQFRLGFAQKQNPMLDEVLRLIQETGFVGIKKPPVRSGVHHVTIGRRSEVLRFLGSIRPVRLLSAFSPDRAGTMSLRTVKLVSKLPAGDRDVVSIQTTSETYIAEGLASHNCDYDWVVSCQMFGAMIDLPKGWPMYCRDLKQRIDDYGNPKIPFKPENEHNALSDARWNKRVYEWLEYLRSKAEETSQSK